MTRHFLNLIVLVGLSTAIGGLSGCGTPGAQRSAKPRTKIFLAPQTGSNVPRQVELATSPTREREERASKKKRQARTKRERPTREEEIVTRGGFR